MHFCVSTARLYGRDPVPRNTSLNWFMPAFVKSSVGSSSGTTGDDGTAVWPCFFTKKSMNSWRTWSAVRMKTRPETGSWLLDGAHDERVTVQLSAVRFHASDDGHDRAVDDRERDRDDADEAKDQRDAHQDVDKDVQLEVQ